MAAPLPPTLTNNPIQDTTQKMDNWSFDTYFGMKAIEILGFDPTYVDPATSKVGALRRIIVDPLGNIGGSPLTSLFDYVSGTNPVYIGLALPGTATSGAFWQIKKLTYDGNNNVTALQYAGGSAAYNQIWDNRASLSYS